MIETDAVVIGAGPVGLFQVFQLGLLGLKAEIIDILPQVGGQCVALYPDKPIYDVPGIPVCTGRELALRLYEQARPFLSSDSPDVAPRNLHLGQHVATLTPCAEGGFDIGTDQGLSIHCKVVFVAAGAGAFVPRSLGLAGLDQAGNVSFHIESDPSWSGKHLVIAGGGDEALSVAIDLVENAPSATQPARISLLHRRDQFQAEADLDRHVRQLIAQGRVEWVVGMPTHADVQSGRLHALKVLGPDASERTLALDHLLIRQGMSPKLGPISSWGLALERKQVTVSPDSCQSSVAGIYAVGDINAYPGKKRLLLCGFHEATMAAYHAAHQLHPDAPQHVLYTTTSPLLHERLGVVGGNTTPAAKSPPTC
jgi:thioredoxin reductase (NADPH)